VEDLVMKKSSILFGILFLFAFIQLIQTAEANAKVKMYHAGSAKKTSVLIYKKSNPKSKRVSKMKKGEACLIRSLTKNKRGNWYQVSFTPLGSRKINGYVRKNKLNAEKGTSDQNLSYSGKANASIKMKKIAVDASKTMRKVSAGKQLSILGYLSSGNQTWYKVKFKKIIGYIHKSEINAVDVKFEEQIKSFPASYRKYMRSLHNTYPKWVFKPVFTGLEWGVVQDNETKPGLNVIQSMLPNGGTYGAPFSYLSTSKSCYNPEKDKYTVFDGTNWYGTVPAVVAHYMDPRNSLTPEKIWQFKSLKYEGTEKKSVIKNMLKDTFMSGNYTYTEPTTNKTVTRSYAATFLKAGKKAKISAYFLAARARQELGLKGSDSVSGKYPGYKGYYNYFNIGANDSREGLAIRNGLSFAKKADAQYLKPWDTPYKSICGGAIYLANGYIPVGQITTYFQKFNVVNKKDLYRHQFMSNVQAPTSESATAYRTYRDLNILKNKYIFYVPVYKNMPNEACSLPKKAGNANNYLKKLTLTDGAGNNLPFVSDFTYDTTEYTCEIEIPLEGITLTVNASKVSKHSKILSGTGDVILNGNNKTQSIKVVCQAQNGSERTYTIHIRNLLNPEPENPPTSLPESPAPSTSPVPTV
jgi:beta-N-acetylglucosaminidase